MYVLNNKSLERKILKVIRICTSHFMRLISTDRYFMGKKIVSIIRFFPKKYLFRRISYVHIRGGVRASVLSYQISLKHLVRQFRYNIGGEMHFYQETTEKNLLKSHHSPRNHQSKGCTAENFNYCRPCFTILILRNKLDLVHLKNHVKCKSDIE